MGITTWKWNIYKHTSMNKVLYVYIYINANTLKVVERITRKHKMFAE